MDVSVIIVNYNTLELTKNTIESVIEKTKGLKYEIILVDNASIDGSIEFFENNYKNKIIFIKNSENLGFGRANNKGIEIAKGKYIFFLNSDTLLINNAIKILFDFMEKNNSCGVSGGNLYDLEKSEIGSFSLCYPGSLNFVYQLRRKIYKKIKRRELEHNYTSNNMKVGFIVGADMLISKKVLNEIGNFDEDFFMYYEEIELQYRIRKKGYSIINIPNAKIIHLEGQSTQQLDKKLFKEKKYRMLYDSKNKYYYKTSGVTKVKIMYFFSQLKNFISGKVFKSTFWKELSKVNKEEYLEFLQNYKTLRKDY